VRAPTGFEARQPAQPFGVKPCSRFARRQLFPTSPYNPQRLPLTPGTRLGPYEIISALGAGGMGEVWKARDTRVDRLVAIKHLKAEHINRFKQEARAIAALNHPRICQLYDVGPDYLVMEYVEGKPLKGPVPVADAQTLALQIADALAAAHRKGIVHRDLKPANILVNESGAKLLDFGLAQMIHRLCPTTRPSVWR
jgi:serine/threonine protein kinase